MIWQTAYRSFLAHPLTGWGPETFQLAFEKNRTSEWPDRFGADSSDDAHNDLIHVLVTCGVVGFAAYLALIYRVFKSVSGPVLGSLTAFFINIKLNPVALEALVLAAILAGVGVQGRPFRMWGKVVFLAVSLLIAATSIRIAYADHLESKRDFISLRKACLLNPYETNYKIMFQNEAVRQLNNPTSWETKTEIVRNLRHEAEAAIVLRPNFGNSWHIAGTEAQIEQQFGIKRHPLKFINRALALDPFNPYIKVVR